MRREHFEWLWRQCSPEGSGIVLDPELQGIDRQTYEPWIESGILDEPFVPKRVIAPEADIRGLATVDRDRSYGYIINDAVRVIRQQMFGDTEKSDLMRLLGQSNERYAEVEYTMYRLNRDKLATHVAEEWGLDPGYKEAPPVAYQFGWKDSAIPVVVLAYGIDLTTLASVVIETQENLKSTEIWVIDVGRNRLRPPEQRRLDSKGIIYLGTGDFLTDEGTPKWDAREDGGHPGLPPFCPLIIDKNSDEILYRRKRLPKDKKLTHKESHILKALMISPSQRVPWQELSRLLWMSDSLPDDPKHTIEVYVHKIRKKLPDDAARWVQTLSGGYVFRSPDETSSG